MTDPLAAARGPQSTVHHPQARATVDDASANIRQAWSRLVYRSTPESLDSLRARGIQGQIPSTHDAALRWVYWKLYLSPHLSTTPSSWTAVLDEERKAYDSLRRNLLRAPDGNYPPGVSFDTRDSSSHASSPPHKGIGTESGFSQNRESLVHDLSVNNPLSLDEANPWKTYYAALDVRKTILQDVERTFPEVPIFRQVAVQQALTNALFVWCLQNDDVGYRQGMHELLATLWLVRSDSAVSSGSTATQKGAFSGTDTGEELLQSVLGQKWIEHDVYSVFCLVMRNAKSWFEWRDQQPSQTAFSASRSSKSMTTTSLASSKQKTVMPIVTKCDHIQALLHTVDPALAQHLDSLGIEPQIFALRWVRLIFTREFTLEDALIIWDGLFAADPSLELVDYICLALLIRVRNQLLAADYPAALQILLRYPSGSPNLPHLFVQQAIQIQRDGANPSTGVAIMMTNRDRLNVALQLGETEQRPLSTTVTSSPVTYQARASKFATVGRASPAAHSPSAWTRSRVNTNPISGQGTPEQGASHQEPLNSRSISRPIPPTDPLGSPVSRFGSSGSAARPFGINASAYLPEGISDFAKGLYVRSELPQTLNSALANVSKTVAAAAAGVAASSASEHSASSGFPSKFNESFSATNTAVARGSSSAATIGHAASPNRRNARSPLAGALESHDGEPVSVLPRPSKVTSNAEMAAALEGINKTNKAVGSALSACIGILEKDWLKAHDATSSQHQLPEEDFQVSEGVASTLATFTALKHIRDVLMGVAIEFDPATLPSSTLANLVTRNHANDVPASATLTVPNTEANVNPGTTNQVNIGQSKFHQNLHLPMTIPEYSRYGRQMILSDFGLPAQLRLREAKVLVVGAGGLGCPAVQYLAAAGVGRISIIDHDVVEPSNLARQILHTDDRIGMQKAQSAAQAARQLNPHISVTPICMALDSSNARQVIKGQDLVLDCTDNPLARYLVSDAAVLEGVQVVSGAAQGYDGQLVVLHKKIKQGFVSSKAVPTTGSNDQTRDLRGPCYRCLFPKSPKPEEVANCEDAGVLGGITGLVGTMQALEAIKILAQIGEETPPLMTLMAPMTSVPFRSIKIRPRRLATCRSCGDPAQVPEPMISNLETEDYVTFCGLKVQSSASSLKEVQRMSAGQMDTNSMIVDVRPKVEYGIARLPNSINIPILNLLKSPRSALEQIMLSTDRSPSSTTPILVVCKKGNDSQQAVQALNREQAIQTREKQAEVERNIAQPTFADPLGQSTEQRSESKQVNAQTPHLAFTDLIGGLRGYSRDKNSAFPIY